ncbi:MAG: T9SS type A sorting domain-containing protein [bacterium]
MKFAGLALLLCFGSAEMLLAQRQSWFIPPKDTDSEITTDLAAHYVALNQSAAPKNQLFLHFPGTAVTPSAQQQLANTAADLGFHVISLNYPNDQAVNDLCGGQNTDLDCYAKVRLEIIDGIDRTPLLNITRPNSIENRLIKLLAHLPSRAPNAGWAQFLENDSTIIWSSIIVSGHSQGGGHAGIIGRYHRVARVIMFAAMDYNGPERKPANWIAVPDSTPNATPAERFYGFSHQRDGLVNFAILSALIWPAYGMNAFGPVVNVDTAARPYSNTHSLTSNLNSPTNNYHGCVAGDRHLALQPDGTPVYKPVWEYLLSNTVVSVKEEKAQSPSSFLLDQNYPNPFNPSTTIRFSLPNRERVTLKVFDVLGREVATLVDHEVLTAGHHARSWEANNATSGVYFYRLVAGDFQETRKMILTR